MASSSSSNSWILSLKVLLISACIVSVAVTVKSAIPLMLNFAVYDLPVIWSFLIALLKPPYLYVVINGIIITIAASTRFQHNNHHDNQSHQQLNPQIISPTPPSDLTSDLPSVSIMRRLDVAEHPQAPVVYDIEPNVMEAPVVYESEPEVVDVKPVAVSGPEVVRGDEHDFVMSRSTWNIPQSVINSPLPPKVQPELIIPVREKQLLSSRFAHNRKPIPEGGRVLRVLKPKKHETMETTWKMITEKRHMPLTRHLRKSDTFVNHHHEDHSNESEEVATTTTKVVRKSETFKERTSYENENDYPSATNSSPASGGKLKKDGSLSNDELNRRVEAFIKKFNDDMRLQRQESLNQYMERMNRGAH